MNSEKLFLIIKNYRDNFSADLLLSDQSIVDTLELDSINLTSLLIDIECEFDIEFLDPAIYSRTFTFQQLVKTIQLYTEGGKNEN